MKAPDVPPASAFSNLIDWSKSTLRKLERGVRQDLSGGLQGLGYFRHLLRGNRVKRSNSLESLQPAVLLLHGYLGTRGAMYLLETRLRDSGLNVFSFNLGLLNIRDIRKSALLIQRKIETILARLAVAQIDIVGHSMGGLIALHYVKKLGGHQRVRKLIMLGTPVKGTWSALPGVIMTGVISPSAWQSLPGSRFLRELAAGPLPAGVDYTTIAAQRDRICPPCSTSLDGAEAHLVPLGHSSLVVGREAFDRILAALGRGQGI